MYITIHFFATNCLQTCIGDIVLVIKGTASKVIHEMMVALCELHRRWIKWFGPLITVSDAFYRISDFPGIFGCIDCTHVQIQRPNKNNAEDINRKCTFSINTQVICDHKLRIVDVVCRWPGSVHDARIFDNSVVKHRLETRQLNGILLADSGYPCRNYILTPFLQPTLQQESPWVEHCFGVLKRRFLCLQQKLRYSSHFCCNIILYYRERRLI